MSTKNADFIQRLTDKVQSRLDQTAQRVAEKLAPALQSGDAKTVPTKVWHNIIETNWSDPTWRKEHAEQVGYVKMVQDALEAHGLSPSLLDKNADVIVQGLSEWNVPAHEEFADHMDQYAQEQGIPQFAGGPIPSPAPLPTPVAPTPPVASDVATPNIPAQAQPADESTGQDVPIGS